MNEKKWISKEEAEKIWPKNDIDQIEKECMKTWEKVPIDQKFIFSDVIYQSHPE